MWDAGGKSFIVPAWLSVSIIGVGVVDWQANMINRRIDVVTTIKTDFRVPIFYPFQWIYYVFDYDITIRTQFRFITTLNKYILAGQ